MRRLFIVLVLLIPLQARSQFPVVRAHLEPTRNIMVGQPVRLVVSIFVPNYFTGSPEFPEFEIENAIVVQPQDRPANSNTQIGNATYFGITQTYIIYPQQAGDFRVPSAKLSVPYANAPPKSTIAEVPLPPLSFHADVPSTARDLRYFLPTTRLTITEHWSRPLKGLRTGDTVERTITITASKMQAMLIPPIELEQPDGIRIYNGEPAVRDHKTDHGEFVYGQRVQTAKYFVEKPGSYTLPVIELTWWNLSQHKITTSSLREVHFSAVADPRFTAELPPLDPPSRSLSHQKHHLWERYRIKLKASLAGIVLLVALLVSAWLFRYAYREALLYLEAYKSSESACFRKLIRHARSNDAKPTYIQLLKWASHISPEIPLGELIRDQAHSDLRSQVEILAMLTYSPRISKSRRWKGAQLAHQLKGFRSQMQKRKSRPNKQAWLSTLNPF